MDALPSVYEVAPGASYRTFLLEVATLVQRGTVDGLRLRELSFQFEESSCATKSRNSDGSLSCVLPARSAGETAWVVSTYGYKVVFDPVYGMSGVTLSADKTPKLDTIMIAGTAPIPATRPTNIKGKPVKPTVSSAEISWTPGAANE